MKQPYLEVTFRHGQPMAAYLYLPRKVGDKSCRSSKADPGMIIDFEESGRAIGIEITAPTKVTLDDLNRVLKDIGGTFLTREDLAPLQAA